VAVLGEEIGGSAVGATIDGPEESLVHQIHVAQPFRLRAGAAADADVRPNISVDWNGEAAEIERPAVNAEPRAEEAVRQAREIGVEMERNFGTVAGEQNTPGTGSHAVLAIEIRERGKERAGIDMEEAGGARDGGGEIGRGSERVDVAAAPGQPAVQAIAKRRRIGDGDIEGAGGFQDASDFGEGAVEIVKVFQAVVGDDGVECVIGEGKAGGIGLHKILGGSRGAVKISADGDKWSDAGGEAAGAGTQVEHALAGAEVLQNFVHGPFLTGRRREVGSRWRKSPSFVFGGVFSCANLRNFLGLSCVSFKQEIAFRI